MHVVHDFQWKWQHQNRTHTHFSEFWSKSNQTAWGGSCKWELPETYLKARLKWDLMFGSKVVTHFFHDLRSRERKQRNRKFPIIIMKAKGKGLPGVQHWLIECMGKISIGLDGSFPGEVPPRAGQWSSKKSSQAARQEGEEWDEQLCRSSQDSKDCHFVLYLDKGAGWPHPSWLYLLPWSLMVRWCTEEGQPIFQSLLLALLMYQLQVLLITWNRRPPFPN